MPSFSCKFFWPAGAAVSIFFWSRSETSRRFLNCGPPWANPSRSFVTVPALHSSRSTSKAFKSIRGSAMVCRSPYGKTISERLIVTATRLAARRMRQSLLFDVDLDVQLAQLFLGDFAGRAHQQVLGLLVHREGDNFANVFLLGQQHDDAVHAGGDAAVRRGAELEGVDHAAKIAFNHFWPLTGDLEH